METGFSLFKSKVARRIFFLFLLCAMLPITIFSVLSFFQVSSQLKKQSILRIQNSAKSYGLILLERFTYLEFQLDLIGEKHLHNFPENSYSVNTGDEISRGKTHLKAIYFISEAGSVTSLQGDKQIIPASLLKTIEAEPISKTKVIFEPSSKISARVFIVKPVSRNDGKKGFLVGEANAVKLWGIGYENILPPLTDVSVINSNRERFFGSFEIPAGIAHNILFENNGVDSRSFEYSSDEGGFFVGYWPMFLKSKFDGPNLIIVMRKKQGDVFEPLAHFKCLFPLVALLSFWIVLLFSISSIRKSMIPLDKLKEGAKRLAMRQFDARVDIRSGDEFESLADTFNQSAAYLGRQFYAMEAMAEIDRVVHASLDKKTIISTALKHLYEFFACDTISFGVINLKKPDTVLMVHYSDYVQSDMTEEFRYASPEDVKMLATGVDSFSIDLNKEHPSFLSSEFLAEIKHVVLQPLFHNQELSGVICLGHKKKRDYTTDDRNHIKRLSNQLSSAIANSLLVEELELLNWGTLEALARTVDAKSRWTAGHSERVASVAVKTARAMGLSPKEIDTLNRAAFLHDIGKIGISLLILDKTEKLTEEEYEQVKTHPVIGAKIIEPIEAYADAVPIILQHHEKYNGTGYPSGIAGEEITIGARILAVADVYDAMISNRPYRQGAVQNDVIKIIKSESGKHFDPMVVDAFLTAEIYGKTSRK